MATVAECGSFKELLLQHLHRNEPVETLLEAAAPPTSVGLETKVSISYFTESAVDFHVSFSLFGKQYNADFVSTWELLQRKRADNGGSLSQVSQQQLQQQQQSPRAQLPLQQHSQQDQHQQQQEEETQLQQQHQQAQHQQQCPVPRVRVQIAESVVTFEETTANAITSANSSISRRSSGGNTVPPFSSSPPPLPSSLSRLSPSSSSPTLASPSSARSLTLQREAAPISSFPLEESPPQRELITACTTVSLDPVCFTWAVIQQLADAVLSVSVGRRLQDKEKAVGGGAMPRGSNPLSTGAQQLQQQNEATLAPKKSMRGDTLLNVATKNKERNKPKPKDNKPIPFFDVFERGDIRVGRLLLLANNGCIRSTSAFNAQISQLEGVHDFNVEVWCSEPPLSQCWRTLLNPLCLTFLEARDVPVPLRSRQDPHQNQHKQQPQQQIVVLSEKEGYCKIPSESNTTQPGRPSSREMPSEVYLEGQWLGRTKLSAPLRPLLRTQRSSSGDKISHEKFERAHAIWEHDVICFCGPALLNPVQFYQYLENIPLRVELHQPCEPLRLQEDEQQPPSATGKRRLLLQNATGARGGGEAPGFVSESASSRSDRPGNRAPPAAASRTSLPRQSASPHKSLLKAAASSKAAADSRGARRSQVTLPQGQRARASSADVIFEETNVVPAHGAADFDLGDICRLGLTYLELVSDVCPVSVKGAGEPGCEAAELDKTIPTAASLLSSPLETFNAVTTKTRRTHTPYLESGTQILLRIQLAEPVNVSKRGEDGGAGDTGNCPDTQAKALIAKPALHLEPFGLVVAVVEASQRQLVIGVKKYVERHNMRILKLESLEALHLELLHADNPVHAALDVLTGFILSDGRRHVVVIEGLRGRGLQYLSDVLKRKEHVAFWQKLLYNPRIGFPRRFYSAFYLRLRWIRLATPIEALPLLLLDSSTVEAQQVAAALDQLATLLRATRMREAKFAKAFPSAGGLLQLSHLHGEDEESEDSLVRAVGQQRVEVTAFDTPLHMCKRIRVLLSCTFFL